MARDEFYKNKNAYEVMTDAEKKECDQFSKDYMSFLDASKTEREAVETSIQVAKYSGFSEYRFGDKLEKGGKYYLNNRGRSVIFFVIGTEPLENGVRIAASHIDSPRIDLKQHPLYESDDLAYFKTHYYGGIRKYQWATIPLAMHGVVVKADGTSVKITVGENDSDPVFYIDDLLPHLAKEQNSRSLGDGITGEQLNILVGSIPVDKEGSAVKAGVLKILNEKYGITDEDFISAEISLVPAFKSRYIGFDRSLIGGYGHDDRCCAYPSLRAIIEVNKPVHTLFTVLADKEEVGSMGNTGMQSEIFVDLLATVCQQFGANFFACKHNSKCLSADVNAAYDPNFSGVFEKNNACFVNHGVVLTKFTGSRGKSGTSDASAEYVGFVRRIFDNAGIVWQTGELGKVDQGGGGTVAQYIANKNIEVVDLGVAVISMHAPYEVISKADLYMAYRAFKAFNADNA